MPGRCLVVVQLLLTCGALVSEARSAPHALRKRSSVCYGELGCFNNDPPFWGLYRPISFLPQSPESISPSFKLFTRASPTTGHLLRAGDPQAPGMALFDARRPSKFIVHGFVDNTFLGTWMMDMTTEFLKQGDYNVIIVDWGSGSLNLYGKATANTRVVGAMIAQLITFLQNRTGAKPEDMHIIGHSLGAHTAGYAGERLRYLGRITGLDPAEPYFQNMDKVVRLDPSDALFVDVIHTDAASFYSPDVGFGMSQACGHVDYYVNGGHDQPGCDKSPIYHFLQNGLIDGARETVGCNHMRAFHFFNESINSACPFRAYRCASEDAFNRGNCVPCQAEGDCGFMGLHADKVKVANGGHSPNRYYLLTGDSFPYCRYHYKVALAISNVFHAQEERGSMYLTVYGSDGTLPETKLNDDDFYIKPGSTYTYVVTSSTNIGRVRDVTFRWVHDSHLLDLGSWNPLNFRHPTLYVNRVTVVGQEMNSTTTVCGHHVAVETGDYQRITAQC